MKNQEITIKYTNTNDDVKAVSVMLYMFMIAEQFGFAYEIVSIINENDNELLLLKPYRPQKSSNEQVSLIDLAYEHEQLVDILRCEDDSAGKRSKRAIDGQKQLFKISAQFSSNGIDFCHIAEPKASSKVAMNQSYELQPREIPFEMNGLDFKKNHVNVQEKCQKAVEMDGPYSSIVDRARREVMPIIKIIETFDGKVSRIVIHGLSGLEFAEKMAQLFSRAHELYREAENSSEDSKNDT